MFASPHTGESTTIRTRSIESPSPSSPGRPPSPLRRRGRPSTTILLTLASIMPAAVGPRPAAADEPPTPPEWIDPEWYDHEAERRTLCGITQCSSEYEGFFKGSLCVPYSAQFGCGLTHSVSFSEGETVTRRISFSKECLGATVEAAFSVGYTYTRSWGISHTAEACETCQMQICWPDVVAHRYRCAHRGTVQWKIEFPDSFDQTRVRWRKMCWRTPDACDCTDDVTDGAIDIDPGEPAPVKGLDTVSMSTEFIPGVDATSSLESLDLDQLSILWFHTANDPVDGAYAIIDSEPFVLLWPSGDLTISTRSDLLATIDGLARTIADDLGLKGDFDGSGVIEATDVSAMLQRVIDHQRSGAYDADADLDGDGTIGFEDLAIQVASRSVRHDRRRLRRD